MYPPEIVKPMQLQLENAGFTSLHTAQEVEKAALNEPSDVSVLLDEAQGKFFLILRFVFVFHGVRVHSLKFVMHLPFHV